MADRCKIERGRIAGLRQHCVVSRKEYRAVLGQRVEKVRQDHARRSVEPRARFVKVFPIEYKRALGEMASRRLAPAASPTPEHAVAASGRARAGGKKEAVPAK